ncbi:hypothetical protein HCJ66_01120 [Listeria sp. FSL L7-1582]|uniref:hypothetical protein n=1 Tax=Listeria portnoyi TaxID=2713504 RepID=UPI00164DC542|nr:hypothetical protein [Listeria portnoyi]MBC6308143.1 hypothetical protein [Listeria portnoyi]
MDRTKEEYKQVGYEFPARIAFYLMVNEKGELSLFFNKVKNTKTQLENVKFSALKVFMLSDSVVTPLQVEDVPNFEKMNETLKKLRSIWIDRGGTGEQNAIN